MVTVPICQFFYFSHITGKPMFPKLRELLRLVVPEAQNGQPLDMAYTHSGFAMHSPLRVCVVCAATVLSDPVWV